MKQGLEGLFRVHVMYVHGGVLAQDLARVNRPPLRRVDYTLTDARGHGAVIAHSFERHGHRRGTVLVGCRILEPATDVYVRPVGAVVVIQKLGYAVGLVFGPLCCCVGHVSRKDDVWQVGAMHDLEPHVGHHGLVY